MHEVALVRAPLGFLGRSTLVLGAVFLAVCAPVGPAWAGPVSRLDHPTLRTAPSLADVVLGLFGLVALLVARGSSRGGSGGGPGTLVPVPVRSRRRR